MKVDEWLALFRTHPEKKLFSHSDLIQLVDEPADSIAVQLTRLVQNNILSHVARGWYANPFHSPTTEEIAMVLRIPSYLSLEYALSRHGILSQRAYTLTLVTTQKRYLYERKEAVYEYHQIKKTLFWGYTEENTVLVATPEKALLDLVYLRIVHGDLTMERFGSLLDDMYLEDLDTNKVHTYSQQFGGKTKEIIRRRFMP
jgi:predicted transcriptional regulator of viral defense system